MTDSETGSRDLMSSAAESLEQALDLLDRAGAPAHIAAHVDLALCQLREGLKKPKDKSRQ